MANLGTLWFGADIDLTALKQKINQGNQSVLDALKMNYDPKSYQEMVTRLRSELGKETFNIKISTDTSHIRSQVQNAIGSIGMGGSSLAGLTGGATSATHAVNNLGKANKQTASAARELESDSIRLNTTLANGIHISTRLGSALSSLFAVHYARQFLDNVIEIGGQLEKQRISIGAILGDMTKANHLFEQIKDLAVKSPFGVVELDQYTKQLSAYGFKYNELFDMTKRLADISAGAGQDIGRLTLALGHVRSATYLTGITLRQFSMNNIPMLKMLADYYTEVEKKAVSTAEVQERISKRQVSYEDVIEQIRRLTDEGGMFYNMQEKISESVAAKYKNLGDAVDIMYGEMAESNLGDFLKGLAESLLTVTRHWKEISSVMSVAAVAFMASRTNIGLTNLALNEGAGAFYRNTMATKKQEAATLQLAARYRELTVEEQRKIMYSQRLTYLDIQQAMATGQLTKEQLLNLVAMKRVDAEVIRMLINFNLLSAKEVQVAQSTNRLTLAWNALWGRMKSFVGGIGTFGWVSIGAMVGMEMYSAYSQWVDRIDDKTKEMKDLLKSRISDLSKEQSLINEGGKPKDNTALKARIDSMKQVLANSEEYTKTIDQQLEKSGSLAEQYDILAGAIDKAVEKQQNMLKYSDAAGDMIKGSTFSLNSKAPMLWQEYMDWVPLLGNGDITTVLEELNEAEKGLRKATDGLYLYKDALHEVIEEVLNSNEIPEKFKENLRSAPFEEQLRLLAESGMWKKIEGAMMSVASKYGETADDVRKRSEIMKDAFEDVADKWKEIATGRIPMMMLALQKGRLKDIDDLRTWTQTNKEEVKGMLDELLNQFGAKTPHIRKYIKTMFYDFITFGKAGNSWWDTVKGWFGFGGKRTYTQEQQKILDYLLDEEEQATLKDDTKAGKKDKNKKDKELERARTKLQQYKAFLSEYKKYRETYGKDEAINVLEKLFPEFKGQGAKIVDEYDVVLDKLRNSLALTTEARKKFANEIDKTKAETALTREKEILKENNNAMKEYIEKAKSQWNLFNSLMKKTGNNTEFSLQAFEKGEIWDYTATDLLRKFNERRRALGSYSSFSGWNMTEKEMKEVFVNADGQIQEELITLYKQIGDTIRANYKKFLEETADAYNDSLTEEQKLAALIAKRDKYVKEKALDNNKSESRQNDYDVLISATDKAIAKQKWNVFKSSGDFARIFSNLDKVTNNTLRRMIERLRELKPDIDADAAAAKALYEALDKAEDKILKRDPFKAMDVAAGNYMWLKNLQKRGSFIGHGGRATDERMARYFGVNVGDIVSQEHYEDKLHEERVNLINGLNQFLSNMQSIFNQLGSMLDGFAGKLMSSLGSMMGSAQSGLAGAKEGGFFGWAQAAMSAVSIIETGVRLLDDISDPFADEVKKINKVTDAIYAMRDAIREAGQEANTWFNDDGLIGLKNDMQDNIDALDKYNAKLYEVQGKYQNASSGLSKTWGAIAGGVTGAIEGALTGVIFGPVGAAAGLVIGAAVGTAVGVGVQKGVEAGVNAIFPDHDNTEYAKDNLRVQTKHRTFFRSEKTQDLQSWIYENMADKAAALGIKSLELFDAQGMINKELAQAVLDSGATLVGETQETLETLIKYKEEYDEYLKALHEYVENLYSPLIDNVTDAIWDAYAEGKDALDSFKNYAQDTFKDIAKDLIKSLATKYIFQDFGDNIAGFYDKYLRGEISERDLNSAIGRSSQLLMGRYEEYAPKLQYALESFGKVLDYYTGIDITADAESNISEAQGTIHAAQSLSEDTGNQLVGRITATQIAVETFRVQQGAAMATSNSLLEIISQQVTLAVMHLQNISGNPNGDSNSVANDILWQQVISNQYLYDIMTSNKAIYEEWGPMIVEMRDKINTL